MAACDQKSEFSNAGKEQLEERTLILHNDDVNTFEHVIRVLQDVCLHNKEQAEQCAVLTHYIGYCEIKRGALVELEQLQQLLSDRELIVTIN